MAKSKPYIKELNFNSENSHQTSPHWIITFVRWNNRNIKNYPSLPPQPNDEDLDFLSTRDPLVVENDCISISVSTSKTNNTPNATAVFKNGDLNYMTAIAPGDFFLVNIVNFSKKARDIRIRAGNENPINKVDDGFKGIFKVNNVNKIIQTDPQTGAKDYVCQVTGYAFTEFNQLIYANPLLVANQSDLNIIYNIAPTLLEQLKSKENVGEILPLLAKIVLGEEIGETVNPELGNALIKERYIIPKKIFKLLGINSGISAINLYKMLVGVWPASQFSLNKDSEGFNPRGQASEKADSFLQKYNNGFLSGRSPVKDPPLTGVRLVDLLKSYSNSLINEIYFCFRIDRETNSVLPKVIIRQKPFNSEHGKTKEQKILKGTKFLSLPRWKISPDLIYNLNLSRNESLRVNFVQIIGKTENPGVDTISLSLQTLERKNIRADEDDMRRHGMRAMTRVSNFDWTGSKPEGESKEKKHQSVEVSAPLWTDLVWDWVYGGELRLNGTISCVGIEDNICVGDNLQIGDDVFHIESITHTAGISPNGVKAFRTNIKVTHGISEKSNEEYPVYSEMIHTDAFTERKDDFKENKILPGFSDTQDILQRTDGEETEETKQRKFIP
jgi:hypothetical protein